MGPPVPMRNKDISWESACPAATPKTPVNDIHTPKTNPHLNHLPFISISPGCFFVSYCIMSQVETFFCKQSGTKIITPAIKMDFSRYIQIR
jgi:hypothetical protein